MKVLQLMQDSYLPTISGNALVLDRFDRCMNGTHKDIIMVWNNDRPEEEVYNGTRVFNPSGNYEDIKAKVSEVVDKFNIDLIISHAYEEDSHISVISEFDLPNILVAHYYYENMDKVHAHFDKVLSFQENQINDYVEKQDVPREKMFFFPPPIDTNIFKPRDTEQKSSMLYVGRFLESKGMHKILPYLNYIDMDFRWVGPKSEDDYRDKFMEIARENNVEDRVHLLGKLEEEELAREYNRNKAFMLLSNSDCYSLVLQESIASGTTPVALENYGSYDWTKGHIFIENSIEMCAHRLKMMREGKCEIKYDQEFINTLSMETNAPRLNKIITNTANKNTNSNFNWEDEYVGK